MIGGDTRRSSHRDGGGREGADRAWEEEEVVEERKGLTGLHGTERIIFSNNVCLYENL